MSDTEDLVDRAVQAARELCGLEVAYVAEFVDGALYVRRSSERGDSNVLLEHDTPVALEETYCQRIVDGRLSRVVRDTAADPVTAALPVTAEGNLGAYVGVPVRLPDGRLYGTLCAASSTAQPALEQRDAEMLAMLARLIGDQIDHALRTEAMVSAHQEFLASVSHDMRTPLRAVSFLAEDLSTGAEEVDPRRAGATIVTEVDRVLGMVDDVLLVAGQRAGALHANRTSVDLTDLAREAATASAKAAGVDGERVACDLPVEGLLVDIDAALIRRLLQNLVDNALKHSPDGGAVTVRVRRENSTALLEVADEGIGIDVEDVEQLGVRFFRAGTARERGLHGIGLGLATVQAVVEAHEGTWGIDSERGLGSTFRVRLPLRPIAAP